ncbi:MAG TPA: bifunctional phosphoglucose/phosphomannose isomerase [Bacteroidia bacterium]|jgi:glucose/mannose-6-phosphate isomerase|nr:bifunctional phosphoglucose/phosphomannose isomerase [Bacteroidia bacterium]
MKDLVAAFSKQLKEAIEIGKKAKLTPAEDTLSHVLICGLGGSGIGGSIVSEMLALEAKAPIQVSKGYFIPAYVNKNTLVIISSYSGNTEETLQCFEQAIQKKAKIVCISSGGKITDIAAEKKLDNVKVPGGMPPRSCLGYSLTQLLFILHFNGICSNPVSKLEAAIKLIEDEEQNILKEAAAISEALMGKLPVIYSTTYYEGIAIRFRQQLNENAKLLCWHQVIPEMNHNELVGWREKNENIAVILFRDTDEYERNNVRIEINKNVIAKYTPHITEIWSKGKSIIEKSIYFIHLGDWVSIYLAEKRGFDASEINVINDLKSELSKL